MKPSDEQVEAYIEHQIQRLPRRVGVAVRQLRRPGAAWLRAIFAVLLILGGMLWFFPILGLWMLPLGLLLIADQFPAFRRWLVTVAMRLDRSSHPLMVSGRDRHIRCSRLPSGSARNLAAVSSAHSEFPAMTTQLVDSTLQAPVIGVNHTGVVLGCLFGAMHLGWAVLVAAGLAQPVADFVYWLHFIRPVWVIEPFEPFRAVGLVVLTAVIGYLTRCTFALIWNHMHRPHA